MLYLDVKGIIDNEQTKAMMEFWGGGQDVFTVETVRRVLAENPDEPEITLNIDCDGGSVEEGLKIYDELRGSGKTIHTNVTGGCHSMAVALLLAAPEENRSANRNVRALIHRVYIPMCDYLTADDCLEIAEACMMEEDAILDIYVERTGQDRETLAEIMRQEKVHDAKSLLDLNFISKINTYNTNQFFNSIKNSMAKNEQTAYEKFMSKVNAYKNKRAGKAVNFDYKDAEGEVVFSTESEEDTLAEGDTVTIAGGETSGTFVLDDGREVTIEDSVVTGIVPTEPETLEERVTELEALLDEATNVIQEQETELNNLRGSDYTPKNRKTQVPATKPKGPGADNRGVDDIKAQARDARERFNAAGKVTKK